MKICQGFPITSVHSSRDLRRLKRVLRRGEIGSELTKSQITVPREIERTGNEWCKFTINLS